jgi:hypothetical protein
MYGLIHLILTNQTEQSRYLDVLRVASSSGRQK